MANSRYDNIRYYDGSFKIPSQIKVFDGTNFVDYGTKNSYSQKKINAYNGSSFFCATYYRHDVNIPKTIAIGGWKSLDLRKSNGSFLSVDTYHANYIWEMTVEVNSTTSLYTAYTRNQGDIINQSYTNYIAEVSGNAVRLRINTHFSGNRIQDGKYVTSTLDKYTPYCFTRGEKVRILMTKSSTSSSMNIKIYNMSGTLLCNVNVGVNTQWVGTPNNHKLGQVTVNNSGGTNSYGDAKVYYFKTTPTDSRGQTFILDFTSQGNGATTILSSGSFGGYGASANTSVYGSSYTEYIRQSI